MTTPKVMGIVNATPDSFYDKSRAQSEVDSVNVASKMLNEGAEILDIGGYSSRPGSLDISEEEEMKRVIPCVKSIRKNFPGAIISIDTFRSSVARRALDVGAQIVNDITAGIADPHMPEVVRAAGVPYIIMHMRGTPKTMNTLTNYEDVVLEVFEFLRNRLHFLRNLGIVDLVADPGFGFAKSVDQNYELLRNLTYFNNLGVPLLIGISRKSMICKTLGIQPENALNGTTVLNTISLNQGAGILRVHDVKEAVETIKLYKAIYN